jgi:hypothetical protein
MFGGSLALGLALYIPVPLVSGGSLRPYEVRVEFICRDLAGCVVDPSRMRFTGDAESGAVESRCRAAPLNGEPPAGPDRPWRLMPPAGVALSCDLRTGSPATITLDLGDAVVIGDVAVRAPSVVLRRVVAYDGYW